ncbi:MAG: endo-1,4-beta-xylanase [Patescibacteria group bacterium]
MKIGNVFLIFFILVFIYFFIGKSHKSEDISWGVNFSQKHTVSLGLDWKETYSAILDDLGVKKIKLAVHWDLIQPTPNEFNFEDLDWQIKKAQENDVKMILLLGIKTSRWPECHVPTWAKNKDIENQQIEILKMLEAVVSRYKDNPTVERWQIENEPFFPFGECQWVDEDFLKKEIELVKSLDNRPIIISDSGEGSFWFKAAKFGDIVGITTYKKVWMRQFKIYFNYPIPSIFYKRRADIIKMVFNKEVICIELQAEPWGPELLYTSPQEEQMKTMNPAQFNKNIEFASNTGFKEFYLWGSEWWYWMKTKQGDDGVWQEAKKLF